MNRCEMTAALREAKGAPLAGKRRLFHGMRAALSEAWVDEKLQAELAALATVCGESLKLGNLVPLGVGETWLLLADHAGVGDVARACTLQQAHVHRALARGEVGLAIRGLAAAASRAGKVLSREALSAKIGLAEGDRNLDVNGSSLRASVCVAVLSRALGAPPRSDVAVSASVDENGTLQPVSHVRAKAVALHARWRHVSTVIVAEDQPDLTPVDGIRWLRLREIGGALREVGLDLADLPDRSVEQLEERLDKLIREDGQLKGIRNWAAISLEAWGIGQRLRQSPRPRKWLEAHAWAGLMASHAGDHDRAVALLDDLVGQEIKDLRLAALARVFLASSLIDKEPERALATAHEAIGLVRHLPDADRDDLLGKAIGTCGRVLMHCGDPAGGEQHLKTGVAHHNHHDPLEVPRSACYLACCLRLLGRLDESLQVATSALQQAERDAARSEAAQTTTLYARLERGRTLAALGRHEEAVSELERVCLAQDSEEAYPRMGAHRSLVGALRAVGRMEEARDNLRVCERIARSNLPATGRRVGAVGAAEELLAAVHAGREPLLPASELKSVWTRCFEDRAIQDVVPGWIY